jgi:hypothetical protein
MDPHMRLGSQQLRQILGIAGEDDGGPLGGCLGGY